VVYFISLAVDTYCMETTDKKMVRKLSLKDKTLLELALASTDMPKEVPKSAREYIERHPSQDLTAEGYPASSAQPIEIKEENIHRKHHIEIHKTLSVADGKLNIDTLKESDEHTSTRVSRKTLYISNTATGIIMALLGAGVTLATQFGDCKK
jgi:hypothetical protein